MHQGNDNACLTETIGLASGAVAAQAGSRPHRHNEVELNFLERGALTYLFGKQKIVVSAGQLIVFWAIMPHSILEAEARLRRIAQPMPSQPPLPTQQMTTHLHQKVEAMIGFITEHYREQLQLGQIAQAVGLHPGYATELFRKTFGITIMDYLAQYRVAHAQRLLATTDRMVLDIAMEAGFTSASRFYVTFQKITGKSPRAYRFSLLP